MRTNFQCTPAVCAGLIVYIHVDFWIHIIIIIGNIASKLL